MVTRCGAFVKGVIPSFETALVLRGLLRMRLVFNGKES